jgi:integrase
MTIETKTARLRLEVRWKPYWMRLSGGISLGYRRTDEVGTWSVRLADGKGGNSVKRIAAADDVKRADGREVMSFAQAREAALRLGRSEDEGEIAPVVTTLADAVETYRTDLAARNGRGDNVTRLLHNLPTAMLKRPIGLLDVEELRKWRNGRKMAPASVNRLATILKAVLNLAATKDMGLSKRAWEIALSAIPEAESANNVVLSESTVIRLVYAAREQGEEFGILVEVLAVTGARYSQLARCRVRDLLDDRLMIPSSAKGTKKRVTRVPVPVPDTLVAALRVGAAGRSGGDFLLVKASGQPWAKSDHARPFRRAVEAIEEDPETVTSYALRHTHITSQLLAGLPVQLVAKLHDTSASQIERHYAATIASQTDDFVRASMLRVDRVAVGDNVVRMQK